MAAETGFTIQGKVWEAPTVDSLNNDENKVLYDCTGFSQEDFFRRADETDEEHQDRLLTIVRHPGFDTAWMRIAFQRGNPTLSPRKVEQIVGATNRLEALATLSDDQVEETDDLPLESTSEHNEPSSSSLSENKTSPKQESETPTNGSATGSESQDATPNGTGASSSDTQPISLREISAA